MILKIIFLLYVGFQAAFRMHNVFVSYIMKLFICKLLLLIFGLLSRMGLPVAGVVEHLEHHHPLALLPDLMDPSNLPILHLPSQLIQLLEGVVHVLEGPRESALAHIEDGGDELPRSTRGRGHPCRSERRRPRRSWSQHPSGSGASPE